MSSTPSLERRQPLQRRLVTAVACDQEPRDAADRRHGYARDLVNLAIGQAVLEVLHDGPAVDERLELGRSAQITEELLAFRLVTQAQDRAVEPLLRASGVPRRPFAIGFHATCFVSMK